MTVASEAVALDEPALIGGESAPPPVDAAAGLVQALLQLHHKLGHIDVHLDDSWQRWLQQRCTGLEALPDDLLLRLKQAWLLQPQAACPDAQRLGEPALRLALQERGQVRRSLCALALARRPGVLRCCLERARRQRLRDALDDVFEPLVLASQGGRPVPAEVISWSPLAWACVGYFDWLALTSPGDRLLCRLVRLSLPRRLGGHAVRRRRAPPERAESAALQMLRQMEGAWPC